MSNQTLDNNKRIAKNTFFLYFRMLLTLVVGLYTSRVVLQILGVSDYGLYNVVGGFVTMLAFLNGTMANGTQRFLSYAIGKGDVGKIKKVFSNALTLHVLIGIVILLLAETVGLWFVSAQMNIPQGRETAALWVYQFSVFTFVISVIQVPFMSTLISHEKMDIYAYMSIYEVTAKLLVVFLIQMLAYDKLILYAALICLVQISTAFLYNLYTRKHYEESSLKLGFDKKTFKEMTSFSLWTLIGAFGCTTNGQGVNVLLNIFFGTAINAARGVAFQVNSIIVGFSRNFQVASNPQIIKFYAEGKIAEMTNLANRTSKYSAYLLLFIMLPVFIDIEYLLKIWLGKYPDYTPVFLRLVLIQSLIQSMSGPVVTVTHAGGKLKMPNLTGGVSILISLPICYIALKMGCSPIVVFIINIFPWFFECFFDAFYAQKYTGFSMKRFYKEVYIKVASVSVISLVLSYLACCRIPFDNFAKLVFVCVICVLVSSVSILFVGLDKQERKILLDFVKHKIK